MKLSSYYSRFQKHEIVTKSLQNIENVFDEITFSVSYENVNNNSEFRRIYRPCFSELTLPYFLLSYA